MSYVFDPKQPCLGLAARILPSYRSKHIFMHFYAKVETFVVEEVVEMKRFLSVGAMTEGRKHLIAKVGIPPLLAWNVLYFQLDMDNIRYVCIFIYNKIICVLHTHDTRLCCSGHGELKHESSNPVHVGSRWQLALLRSDSNI